VRNQGDTVTLTTRLSLFFLVTLAWVLVGFSTVLYFLARGHLHQQAEERLEAALNTLVAAAEVGQDGVEWEPAERHLRLGPAALGDQVVWLLSDDQGQIVDGSKQPGAADLLTHAQQSLRSAQRSIKRLDWHGGRWQCSQRRIEPTALAPARAAAARAAQKDEGLKYRALSIMVGVSLDPVRATLRQLAGVLLGLSLAIWLLALFVGRLVCRRALLPVSRMAVAAREMHAEVLGRRLPTSATGDELEDLSRAFNNLLDRLQESFQRQQRFTGDASHQLRTPLAAMIGQMEVALRRERSAEEYQRVLATVHQKAGHLRRIVEALLFLARADTEARLPELEQVNLNRWLPAHLQTWSEHPRARDLLLEYDAAGSDEVEVQPALLGELVNILLDNACKFSRPGTPIRIRLQHEQQDVCIQVADQGCGICQEDLPYVGTPFFRSADTRRRKVEGIGLGLSIAKRLAEVFGGRFDITSQVGLGSCFSVRLPLPQTILRESECRTQHSENRHAPAREACDTTSAKGMLNIR
jgi:heavy metal sensor kinase